MIDLNCDFHGISLKRDTQKNLVKFAEIASIFNTIIDIPKRSHIICYLNLQYEIEGYFHYHKIQRE